MTGGSRGAARASVAMMHTRKYCVIIILLLFLAAASIFYLYSEIK